MAALSGVCSLLTPPVRRADVNIEFLRTCMEVTRDTVHAGTPAVCATDKPRLAGALPRRQNGLRRWVLQLPSAAWAYFDILTVSVTTAIAYHTLVRGNPQYGWVAGPWLNGAAFSGSIALAGLVFGLYERQTLAARSRILVRALVSLGVGLILGYACISLFFYGDTTRWLGLCVGAVYVAAAIPTRLAAHEFVTSARVNVLCLGSGESIHKIVALVHRGSRPHYRVVGHLDVPASATQAGMAGCERRACYRQANAHGDRTFNIRCPRLGDVEDLQRMLDEHAVDEIVVDAGLTAHASVGVAVLACLDHRCRVTDTTTFIEKYLNEVPAENITAQWFLVADVQASTGYDAVKRILDITAATIGLALTAPLWPLIALLIRIDSRGPVIYKQVRVGRHGRVFSIYKFRTMRADAEQYGARWAQEHDARVTRVGRFLRQSRLDELPQLWNILRGDMSLVGPRPERPEFVEKLAEVIPHYRQRHLIKPGLTGWAQIRFRYGASVEDAQRKLCYDLYYLKHRSIDLDTAIIIRTIGAFLLGAR
jgi:exopolysaccharide biosynthesis polyprenyl glycosylphosphotransferase